MVGLTPITPLALRPGVENPAYWDWNTPPRMPQETWQELVTAVHRRDEHTCQGCGYQADNLNVHKLNPGALDVAENYVSVCVACDAVLHIGRSAAQRLIEIWQTPVSQNEIVRATRAGLRSGLPLHRINAEFDLTPGAFDPSRSIGYANYLADLMGSAGRLSLPEPYCAIFVGDIDWQLPPD